MSSQLNQYGKYREVMETQPQPSLEASSQSCIILERIYTERSLNSQFKNHTSLVNFLAYSLPSPLNPSAQDKMKIEIRDSWSAHQLRFQCCHCYGMGSIPGPGTSESHGCGQKKEMRDSSGLFDLHSAGPSGPNELQNLRVQLSVTQSHTGKT